MTVWTDEMKSAAMRDATMVCLQSNRIAELELELAKRPTEWAYKQACKALAHWRKEAKRCAKLAGVMPRQMTK